MIEEIIAIAVTLLREDMQHKRYDNDVILTTTCRGWSYGV
jgi:hypothetical protein